MTFLAPGVTLTASGRALSEGGVGDTITVQNPASFRQISGIVTDPARYAPRSSALVVAATTSR
ncbi:MAG: flagella basal body P-ring formation protein FlgA [Rhizomicrobium sp.]